MTKVSKKNQSPNQVDEDREQLLKILSVKSQHFAMGTWVVSNNVRGKITGITKDGGTKLMVEWENGTKSIINNPRMNWLRLQREALDLSR